MLLDPGAYQQLQRHERRDAAAAAENLDEPGELQALTKIRRGIQPKANAQLGTTIERDGERWWTHTCGCGIHYEVRWADVLGRHRAALIAGSDVQLGASDRK